MTCISSAFYERLGREWGYKQGGARRDSLTQKESERDCPMEIRCSKKCEQC